MAVRIKAVIIEDEQPARDIIKNYLTDFPNIEVRAECSNGFEGLKAIHDHKPDLIILDIQMPKITGFEMLELLEDAPVIIFSTAYDQYALKAFEVSAADYLLKPYTRDRFHEAVHRALKLTDNKSEHDRVIQKIVSHHEQQTELLERIVVKTGSKITILPVAHLYWLEAQDDYVMLHTREGEFLKQKTMKYFEQHLDPGQFIRIHRSYIVKISMIKQIELYGKESYKLILTNGHSLPISKSGHNRLKEILK
ncbi:MAG: LytR/AlgR family response regulator transcription factor [bacterium]